MDLQTGLSTCGASALANALQALGWSKVPAEAVARAAGTTADGTGAGGLRRAARAFGARVGRISSSDDASAWGALVWHLHEGGAAVLAVDRGEHWVSAIGLLGRRVIVVDPAMVVRPMLSTLDREGLLAMWHARKRAVERYAVTVAGSQGAT